MKAIKLFFLILVSLALLGSNAEATITRVQTATASTGATNATSLTITITAPNLTDGKYHYIAVAVGSIPIVSATSDAGYSWYETGIVGANTTGATLLFARVFSGAGTTITLTTVSTAAISAVAAEYKSDGPLRLDRTITAIGSSTSPSTGATQTTSNANELCLAAIAHRLQSASTTGTFTSPANSYTEVSTGGVSTNNNGAGLDREGELLEKFLTATGTTTAGATVTASNNWAAVVATFEEVASTGSTRIPSIGN